VTSSIPNNDSNQAINPPVVAAVIERDRCLLICQRPEGKQHGGLWEFPGGKIHADESISEAVSRELAEELAVQTTEVGEVMFSRVDQRSGFEILFIRAAIKGEPVALEHSAILWCEPEQLLSYPLAPSDHAFATFFLQDA
jgi:(d)CTP diphosphatase